MHYKLRSYSLSATVLKYGTYSYNRQRNVHKNGIQTLSTKKRNVGCGRLNADTCNQIKLWKGSQPHVASDIYHKAAVQLHIGQQSSVHSQNKWNAEFHTNTHRSTPQSEQLLQANSHNNRDSYTIDPLMSEIHLYNSHIKKSHPTSQNAHCVCIKNTIRLLLFGNITAVYCKNRAININSYTVWEKSRTL
jgi:hypothetical protein